jgi:hypothetical protein
MKLSLHIHINGAFDIASQNLVLRDCFPGIDAAQFARW